MHIYLLAIAQQPNFYRQVAGCGMDVGEIMKNCTLFHFKMCVRCLQPDSMHTHWPFPNVTSGITHLLGDDAISQWSSHPLSQVWCVCMSYGGYIYYEPATVMYLGYVLCRAVVIAHYKGDHDDRCFIQRAGWPGIPCIAILISWPNTVADFEV